jgi:uncharacterized membrane protein YkvA (DUF1232 family)
MKLPIDGLYNWYRSTLRNPKYRWWLIIGSLVYLFSPLDISPDFLPIIGWIDDGAVLTLLIAEISQLLGERLKSADKNASTSNNNDASNANTTGSTPVDVKAVNVD